MNNEETKTTKIIVAENLVKTYDQVKALKGVSFNVDRGSMFAFLGPNGSGKSTTINIMCAFLKQDSGRVTIDGQVVNHRVHKNIGIVFQESVLDSLLTVKENLRYRGRMYGLHGSDLGNAIQKVTELLELQDFINRKYGTLSGGQKRRVDIARAMLHSPKLLILDEPTTGLDPYSREKLWLAIKKMQQDENLTVFFSTHYMEEATIANQVVILNKGEISTVGSPEELKKKYVTDKLYIWPREIKEFNRVCKNNGIRYTMVNERALIIIRNAFDALPIIERLGSLMENFEIINGTMNDVYLSIAGRGDGDD